MLVSLLMLIFGDAKKKLVGNAFFVFFCESRGVRSQPQTYTNGNTSRGQKMRSGEGEGGLGCKHTLFVCAIISINIMYIRGVVRPRENM